MWFYGCSKCRNVLKFRLSPCNVFPPFQALPLFPSVLITKLDSAAAWQTSTNTCWWQITWTGATAGCYRSFPTNCVALGGEGKSPAPWTAAWTKLTHRMKRGSFFCRQLDLRMGKRPNVKLSNSTVEARLLFYRVMTCASYRTPNNLQILDPHQILVAKTPVRKTLTVLAMKLKTHRRVCGGLGRADGKFYISWAV